MAKANPASSVLDGFKKKVASLNRSRVRAEKLFAAGHLTERDIEMQYEALFIDLVRSFESSIEKLFLGLIAQTIESRYKSVRPLVYARSLQSARRIVCGDRSYVDWLPYHKYTRRRALAFLSRGLPFKKLPSQVERNLEEVLITRNAIAHQSAHAHKRFRNDVVGSIPLLPRERKPSGFLRSHYALSPPETRFELFASHLVGAGSEFMK